ncbi:3'-5' exonuclease [Vibrio maritimus]|uniref:3'-5' exonuclease n=1 Tax=Vibrio TaxID=662 RepID=UPI00207633B4|nr:3'-5' exonuclease [Vibrio sp. SCSIO 43140]
MVGILKQVMNQFHVYNHYLKEREKYLGDNSVPKEVLSILSESAPDMDTDSSSLQYLVVDFETTGIDAKGNSILSMGWVEVSNLTINVHTARQLFIETPDKVKAETAIINHIVPEMLQNGVSLDSAMWQLFEAAKNKVLIAHGAMIESEFVNEYLHEKYGINGLPVMWLDTLAMEKAMAVAVNKEADIDVRLSETRERYGLPEYNGHEALIDAIATAELFLAQSNRLYNKGHPSIGKLYRLSQ